MNKDILFFIVLHKSPKGGLVYWNIIENHIKPPFCLYHTFITDNVFYFISIYVLINNIMQKGGWFIGTSLRTISKSFILYIGSQSTQKTNPPLGRIAQIYNPINQPPFRENSANI
jgi:hypothetical protein